MDIKFEFQPNVKSSFIFKTFPELIFPNLGRNINVGIPASLNTVLATDGGSPVGLICSTPFSKTQSSRIILFKVAKSYQNKNIGSRLLEILCARLRQNGIQEVFGFYRNHWSFSNQLKKVLSKNNFNPPEWYLSILNGRVDAFDNMHIDTEKIILKKFNIVPWKELTSNHHHHLKTFLQEERVTDILNPFKNPSSIFSDVSIVLFDKENKLAGWIIAHEISPKLLEYTSLFLKEEYRNYGNAISLMKYAVTIQRNKTSIEAFAASARSDNKVMHVFFNKLSKSPELKLVQTFKYFKTL